MRRPRTAGFTLIELTVVLAVIVTLALVLTPSVINFINDSRVARARADTQTIAAGVVQFFRDTGFYPQWSVANNGGPGTAQNKVDLLVSPGNVPSVAQANLWTTGTTDQLADQLLTNAPGFTARTATSTFGWNGPYLSNTINADPWNNRYAVNIGLIDASVGVVGQGGATKNAVWTLSAGPDVTVDTVYAQAVTIAAAGGDDIGFRLQ